MIYQSLCHCKLDLLKAEAINKNQFVLDYSRLGFGGAAEAHR